MIITLQAAEAQAFAAEAAGHGEEALAKLQQAAAIEDSIDDLPQPPYPVIPANELCGELLLDLNRPADAAVYFEKALARTPNRPKIVLGLARTARALGERDLATKRYKEFLTIWKTADSDRPELAEAREFLQGHRQ